MILTKTIVVDPEAEETYSLSGGCRNCGHKFRLVIGKGRRAPNSYNGVTCTNCGCRTVLPLTPHREVPA